MGTLIVKNLPDDLHERLKQLAKRNHRSVTKQVTRLIESVVSAESATSKRPATVQVKGARAMTREELEEAFAILTGCGAFVTGDRRLRAFSARILVLGLDQLANT